MNDAVIETRRLTRYFGSKPAVQDLTLSVPRGSVFGFLGRNGSGKSTTIRMLLGLLKPTRGQARVLGHDPRTMPTEIRGRIGYMAESHPVFNWMTVGEHARFQSRFYRTWNQDVFDGVIDHFHIAADAKARSLSRGEQAGLCLALTLAPEPELLILDDPALGLDPVARRSLIEAMVFVTRGQGRTVFFSSHLLSDVERLADHIAILDHSVLRVCCTTETFQERVQQLVLTFAGPPPLKLPAIPGLLQTVRSATELRLTLVNVGEATQNALASMGPTRIEPAALGLEQAFLDYLGQHGEKTAFAARLGGVA
jgi:ABC-2 type transport system ATP-binding protein